MKLFLCTITGADDKVDVKDLLELSKEFPFVEWGILLSSKLEGTERYPSKDWINSFLETTGAVNTAAHLCGQTVKDFANNDKETVDLINNFRRIQLNFNAGSNFYNKENGISKLLNVSRTVDPFVITQFNEANRHVHQLFTPGMQGRHGVLFDASGGNGVAPGQWPELIPGKPCGFAGGLGPDNVEGELAKISKITKSKTFWIDMESNVRTDNNLDLEKVSNVLSKVKAIAF